MNLHWGRTLQNKAVQLRHRTKYNISNVAFPYNYTEYKLSGAKAYWDNLFAWRANYTASNTSILHAENQFLKKTRILTDIMDHTVRSHSFTTVVVIASLFLFLTLTITAAVVVFCRKKNSVFALQKSEQEDDGEYELDDMITDIEYTETDFESETESLKQIRSPVAMPRVHRRTMHQIRSSDNIEGSPSRRPLVTERQTESDPEDSPGPGRHVCHCGGTMDPRGAYQRMVVTAILERPSRNGNEGADSDSELRTRYIEKLKKHYYALAQTAGSDVESENEGGPQLTKPPIINVTYVDEPPAYDSLDYKLPTNSRPQSLVDGVEGYSPPCVPCISVVDVHRPHSPPTRDCQTYGNEIQKKDTPVMFVELPKKHPPDDRGVVFVDLPPKDQQFNGSIPNSPSESPANHGHNRRVLCSTFDSFPAMPVPTLAIIPPTPIAECQLNIIPPTPMSDSEPFPLPEITALSDSGTLQTQNHADTTLDLNSYEETEKISYIDEDIEGFSCASQISSKC